MSSTPFLSVIMPLHGGERWIGATLDSLLEEAREGVEIIAIDSSPTDATSKIVDSYRDRLPLQFLRRTDLGPWQVKTNAGVELARADHVCMLHQDDLWLAGRAATARRWIAAAPTADLHLAPTAIIDKHGRRLGDWTCPLPTAQMLEADFVTERLLVQNFVSVPAPVIRRQAWLDAGGMDETLWYTADWDIWAKIAARGRTVYHPEVTTAFRVHETSLTVTGSRNASDYRAQMETVLDRHLGRLPARVRRTIEHRARASIDVNVSLAAASGGSLSGLLQAAMKLLSLGPLELRRYLRDSRLRERVVSRLRAKLAGAF